METFSTASQCLDKGLMPGWRPPDAVWASDELMDVTLQWRLAFSKAPDTVAFMDDNTMQQISVQELLGSSTTLSGKLELYRFVC